MALIVVGDTSQQGPATLPENLAKSPPKEVPFAATSSEDEAYLKTYFGRVETAICKSGDNPLQILQDLLGHVATAASQVKDGKAETKFADLLFRVYLVRLVNTVIDRTYPVPEWLDLARNWLHETQRVIIELIRGGYHPEDLIRALSKFFQPSMDFFRLQGREPELAEQRLRYAPTADDQPDPEEAIFAEVHPKDTTSSFYLIEMISKFGEQGGFDAILQRISLVSETVGKFSCSELKQLLELVETIKEHLRRSFIVSYIPRLYALVRAHFENFSEGELRNQSIDDLIDCLISISKIASRAQKLGEVCEDIEKFKLLLSLRCVKLPYLEARLKGMDQIKHLIKVAAGEAHHHTRARPKRQKGGYRAGGGATWISAIKTAGATSTGTSVLATARPGTIPPAPPLPLDDIDQAIANSLADMTEKPAAGDSSSSTTATTDGTSSTTDAAAATAEGTTQATTPTPDSAEPGAQSASSTADENTPPAEASTSTSASSPVAATSGSSEAPALAPAAISTAAMFNWLLENDIINVIFSLDHPEALKQGKDIIAFIAKQRTLDESTLELMWRASKKHESFQNEVFGIICSLLEFIPSAQIEYFYERILEMPPSSFDAQVLTFIGNFTREAIKARKTRNEELKLYGLEIFWSLLMKTAVQAHSDTRQGIINETSEHVKKLLIEYPEQRETFVKRCIDNLASGDMVSVSLKLMADILHSYDSAQTNTAIQDLETKYGLVDSLLADLARTTDHARSALTASATGKLGNLPAVQARLTFLGFILTESELQITRAQALSLWDSLMNVDVPADRDAVLEWLERTTFGYLAPQDPYSKNKTKVVRAFSPEVTEVLFLERMMSMNYSEFSLAALKLYRRFFLAVNAHRKLLRRLEETEVFIRSFELIGMEQFWTIGMESADRNVALNALVILRQLYANVSKRLLAQVHEKRVGFVLKCMDYLLAAAPTAAVDPLSQQRVERCVYLLTTVISNDNKTRHSSEIHSQRTTLKKPKPFVFREPASITSKAAALVAGPSTAAASSSGIPTVEQAPSAVSSEVETAEQKAEREAQLNAQLAEIEELRQAARNEQYEEYLRLVDNLEKKTIRDREEARARQQSEGAAGILRPGDVLSKQFLPQLFALLEHESLRSSVWALIQLVPTDAALNEEVFELTLDGSSSLKLAARLSNAATSSPIFLFQVLYIVQLLRVAAKDTAWCQKFGDASGILLLADLFTGYNFFSDKSCSRFSKQALAYLVETLSDLFAHFTATNDQMNSAFIHRLMNLLASLALQKSDAEPEPILDETSLAESGGAGKKTGTRFANCWYDTVKRTIVFELEPNDKPLHFQAAVYAVDYNTTRRAQTVTPTMRGVPKPEGANPFEHQYSLGGADFHNGQWMLWDCHGTGPLTFDIAHLDGPNWVFVCLLLDPSKHPNNPVSTYPVALGIDSKTQGRWRGKYGRWGGVFLGENDFLVPLRPDHPENAPRIIKWGPENSTVQKYEWEKRLVDDERALQLIPNKDAMDTFVSSDEGEGEVAGSSSSSDKTKEPELPVAEEIEEVQQTSTVLLDMLFRAVIQSQSHLDCMLDYPGLADWLFGTLITCDDDKVRKSVMESISKLSGIAKPGFFLQILLEFLPRIGAVKDGSLHFTEYFTLLDQLMAAAGDSTAITFDKKTLMLELIQQLFSHPVLETDEDAEEKPDTALQGVLKLLATILPGEQELQNKACEEFKLVEYIYHDCLFGVPSDRLAPNIPKCKSNNSRAAAFKLLLVLTSQSEQNRNMVVKQLDELIDRAPVKNLWTIEVDPQTGQARGEAKSKYAGLKNQGCTCYLNSTLQQLFIIPTLRRALLNVPLQTPADGEKSESSAAASSNTELELIGSDPQLKTNLLYQIQTLFAFMQETKNSYVDPLNFCKTVKIGGRPIEMMVQEDANEFFNALADQLEPHMTGTPQATAFRDVFGGMFTHQIISENCEHRSDRPEPFLTISIPVQNKRSVKESLETFIASDLIEGFRCEQCDPPTPVNAKKRCCIEHLPNTLILHLKRFDLDFETFENVKVNDRFEFPYMEELDMFPFTKEGLAEAEGTKVPQNEIRPEDYYKYQLTGILIHSGTANSGHYYSYIKERAYQGSGIEFAQWYEFNDRTVRQFDPLHIPDQCFGGKSDHYGEKCYSAYMLFYERANHYSPAEYGPPLGPLGTITTSGRVEKQVDPLILNRIWNDSLRLAQKKQILSRPTLDCIWSSIAAIPVDDYPTVTEFRDLREDEQTLPIVRAIQLGTRFLLGLLIHCADKHTIAQKLDYLTSLYARHIPSCKWFLETISQHRKCSWLRDVFLDCPDHALRIGVINLLSSVLALCSPHEYGFFSQKRYAPVDLNSKEAKETTALSPQRVEAVSCVVRTIDVLISILTGAADRPAARIQDLLLVLYRFALQGRHEKGILLERNAVFDLVSLYDAQKMSMSSAQGQNRLGYLIDLLAELSCSCDNPNHASARQHNLPNIPPVSGFDLPRLSKEKIFNRMFLTHALKQHTYVPSLNRIFSHWCYGDLDATELVLTVVSTAVDSTYTTEIQHGYLDVMGTLIAIQDSHVEWRVSLVLCQLLSLIQKNIFHQMFRTLFLEMMFDLANRNREVQRWITASDDLYALVAKEKDVQTWLQTHHPAQLELFDLVVDAQAPETTDPVPSSQPTNPASSPKATGANELD